MTQPTGLRDATIQTPDGARIAYRVRAGRDPWVLIHGLGCDASMWDGVVAALPADVGLVVPEIRGHGGSTLGWRSPSVDVWAEDVIAVIRRENLRDPAIGGLSMGGYTVFAIAAASPRLARALAFVSTAATPDDEIALGRRAQGLETLHTQGWAAYAESLMPSLLSPDHAEFDLHRRRLVTMFGRSRESGLACALIALAGRPDRRPLLPKIATRCAIVVGARDLLTPPARAEEIVAGLPDARIVATIPEIAHMSAMEAPNDVARALLALG